jgi:PAS domain S-box-containing protein
MRRPFIPGGGERDGGHAIPQAGATEADMTDYDSGLGANEARLRDVLATLQLCTVMARDFDGTIRFWSAGCERLYGWTADEAIGRSSHQLLQTVFPVPLDEIEAILLRDGEWIGDLGHTKKDGTKILVAAHKAVRRDVNGCACAVMESVSDVTTLRLAEEELQRLNSALEERVQEEVAARAEIQSRLAQAEKLSALGQLAGGIAHDFNNVIHAVTGAAVHIARHAENSEFVRRYAGMIQEAASRGAAITSRLLAFARRDASQPETIDVAALLRGLHELLVRTLGSRVELRLALPEALPSVRVDRRELQTVLINLATNARDAIGDNGSVTLSAHEAMADDDEAPGLARGCYVRFDVSDDGVGMDETTAKSATEPFFTTKEPGKGTGLGLSMARSFAEQAGGALTIDSRLGQGTTVSLWLPATNA